MTLYLNQLIPKRSSNNYGFDVGLGAKFCHQTVILDKSVSLLKTQISVYYLRKKTSPRQSTLISSNDGACWKRSRILKDQGESAFNLISS